MKKIKYELDPDTLQYLPVKQTNYLPSIHIKKPSNGFLGLGCLGMVCLLNFLYFRPTPTGDLRVTCVTASAEKKLLVSRESTEEEKHEEITKTPLESIPDIDVSYIKDEKKRAYVKRFYKVAILEQQKFNIPASITLAQGLIESGSGTSVLATEANNHFGMKDPKGKGFMVKDDKWRTKSGKIIHCQFKPEAGAVKLKSAFREFDRAWTSIREHSLLLKRRYLKYVPKNKRHDYVAWAYGLKKGGYATAVNYPKTIINTVETLKLQQFDKITP